MSSEYLKLCIRDCCIVSAVIGDEYVLPTNYSDEQLEEFMQIIDTLTHHELKSVKIWLTSKSCAVYMSYVYNSESMYDYDEYIWTTSSIPYMDPRCYS